MFAEFRGQTVQRAQDVRKPHHLLSLFLTLILLAVLIIGIKCDVFTRRTSLGFCRDYGLVFPVLFLIVYFIYLYEFTSSETKEYLSNHLKTTREYEGYMRKIKSSAPLIGTSVKCYHYDILVMDETGEPRWTIFPIRITTCFKISNFDYSSWEDTTGEVFGVLIGKDFVKLEVIPTYHFGNEESARIFWAFRQDFTNRYRHRDYYYESVPEFYVSGHQSQVLVQKKGAKRPFWLSSNWYLVFSVFLLSWPYRMWFESISDRKRIVLRKVIYA